MKITPRIPSIDVQKSSEKEIQSQEKLTYTNSAGIASAVDKFEGPDTIQKPKIESTVDIYEGPKSLSPELKNESRVEQLIGYDKNSRRHLGSQQPSIPDFPGGGGHTSSGRGLFGDVSSAVSGFSSDPESSRIGSRVNKYEGPNTLPLRESKVRSYKGPDSIELPKSESPVSNYQGPDSITPPRTRPHVDLTIPGKNKRGYPQSSENPIPDIRRGIGHTSSGRGLLGDVSSAAGGFSSGPQNSPTGPGLDKYKGPDSLTPPEIESEVEKYKGPKSLFDERGSRVEKYKGPDSVEPHEDK